MFLRRTREERRKQREEGYQHVITNRSRNGVPVGVVSKSYRLIRSIYRIYPPEMLLKNFKRKNAWGLI